jgi:predicted PurR-regulated permease PerM
MEEPRTHLPNNNDECYDSNRIIKPLIGIVMFTAVLYLARGLLLPLAMGVILAIIFNRVANRLDQFVGRFISAAMVVFGAIVIVAAVGYFLTIELDAIQANYFFLSSCILFVVSNLRQSQKRELWRTCRAFRSSADKAAESSRLHSSSV